uniref:SAM_MT_RSMB_NOP domain-containing protein n=1 Tax=Heterorhabditis bacteriophora TaxID=37862 RepID=A0A1I7XGZ0_HETBA
MRIVPHHQNTGGFFVALIEKVSEIAFKATSIRFILFHIVKLVNIIIMIDSGPVWKKQKMFKDEPFTFLRKDDERWFDIRDHYGISDHFTYGNLFSRRLAENDANSRQLFFANDAVKNFVMRNMTTVSIQNAGMKMFSRTEQKVESTRFRLSQEGIRHLLPFLNKQKVKISRDDMLKLLSTESTMIPLESLDCKETIRSQKTGSLVLFVNEEDPVCTWVGLNFLNITRISAVDLLVGAPYGIHGTAVQSVACGEKHTLMLAEDGKMWSVGGNEDGQLGRGGRGSGSYTIYPVSFTGGVEIIQVISAGRSHSLAVAEDGRLFAWGSNEHGQLALPHNVRWQETPKRISTLNEVVQVATGPDHCIALLESGLVMVWGEQYDGAILHSPTVVHHLIGIPIVRVSAGGRHCVALSASGAVYTWGQNDFGQLGTGDMRGRPTPYFLEGMSSMGIVEVCCGDSHTVLLNKEGRLFGFGSDAYGQLGCGRKFDKHITPAAVTELMGSHVTRVACGRNHTIVIIGGRVYPFGQNANGQLGNGSVLNQVTPKQTDELDHVCAVFAGWDQTFFMRVAGVQDVSPGPSCRLSGPKFLSKDMVIDLLLKHDKMELIGLIESVFSSVSSINGSFLYVDDRRFLSDPKTFGVNLDDVMDTFNALASSPDARQYAELVMDMCQMSVFSDDFDASQLHSVESLRVFLILPWLETFVVNVTRTTVTALHRPFANAIMRLKPNSRLILGINLTFWRTVSIIYNCRKKWWLGLQVRHFNRIVTAMLSAVRCLVLDKVDPSECLVTNKIPLENFYIHELNNNYNLKQDYAHWASASNQIKQNAPFWSSYPFLMNGAAKGELLHVEALISMHTSNIRFEEVAYCSDYYIPS